MQSIMHIGIDVDNKTFHGAPLCEKSGEILEFSCRPNSAALLKKLRALKKRLRINQGSELVKKFLLIALKSGGAAAAAKNAGAKD